MHQFRNAQLAETVLKFRSGCQKAYKFFSVWGKKIFLPSKLRDWNMGFNIMIICLFTHLTFDFSSLVPSPTATGGWIFNKKPCKRSDSQVIVWRILNPVVLHPRAKSTSLETSGISNSAVQPALKSYVCTEIAYWVI